MSFGQDGTAVDIRKIQDASTLGGKAPDFYVDTITDQNVFGIKTFGNSVKVDSSVIYRPISNVPDIEGTTYYDNEDKAYSLKTDIAGSTQSLGQEFWKRVINKTGSLISDGSVVYKSGFDAVSGRVEISLAKADNLATSDVLGFTTNTMADGAEGFVTIIGDLNDQNTSAFSTLDELFLSDSFAGITTKFKPLNAIPVGFVTIVDATQGQIFTTISRKVVDSPIFAEIVDKTNQKPATTNPTVITFNTNKEIRGITHGTVTATEDIIIDIGGTYTTTSQPQAERTSGGAIQNFHMWLRIGSDDKGGVSAVSVANPSQITTDAVHNLTNGQTVEILNVTTTPDINGQHIITVTGASTYTIPVNVTSVTDGIGDWRRILDINDDIEDSNVELRISGSNASDVIGLTWTQDISAGEKINVIQSVSITTNGIGIVASTPAGEADIPSIILTVNKN